MAKQQKVEVVITPDGKVEADAIGFKGDGCIDAINTLIADLGKVVEEDDKPDKFEPAFRKPRQEQKTTG